MLLGCQEQLHNRSKDHLGSIRITVDENNEITNGQDYLPLDSIYREYNIASTNEKYDFTACPPQPKRRREKERDTETGLNYFGARYYDSDLGRWTSVDPLADKYPGLSPYNYIANNPLRYYDPDGRGIKEFFQGIAKAISFDVTVGFQVGLSGNVYGRNIGGNINIISTSILSGDLSSSPELNNGELSKGVSFGVGIAGISNEVTSATETSETRNGIYTIITETNTNTNTSSTTLGPISAGTTKTTTTTKNVLTGQTNKVVTKTGSVGASKNVKIKGAAGIGVEVKINTSEAWNAVKALFDDNKEDK
ncbi:MAG: RHS repeat-associated core domain-containing protein [Melioribacteraceae bacterium]|nr:RHS repeat-associated core domain-containing protein [Melioribacteraceae bacterium]